VAIANTLQLEAARATPVFFRFNYDAMSSLKSLNLSNAVLPRDQPKGGDALRLESKGRCGSCVGGR